MTENLEIMIKEIEKASPMFAEVIREADNDKEKCELIAQSLKYHINQTNLFISCQDCG